MKITLDNYEAFVLDFYDGNLDEGQQEELRCFLLAHPDVGISLEELDLPRVPPEFFTDESKPDLHKFQTPAEEEVCLYLEGLLLPAEAADFEKRLSASDDLQSTLKRFRETVIPLPDAEFPARHILYRSGDDLLLNNRCIEYLEGQMSPADTASFELELGSDRNLAAELRLYAQTRLSAEPDLVFDNKEQLKRESKVVMLFNWKFAAAAAVFLAAGFFILFSYLRENTEPVFTAHTPVVSAGTPAEKGGRDSVTEPLADATAQTGAGSENRKVRPAPILKPAAPGSPVVVTTVVAPSINDTLTAEAQMAIMTPDAGTGATETSGVTDKEVAQLPVRDLAPEDDELVYEREEQPRNSFWQRITHLAGEANKLGVKAVDGEILPGNRFRLSIRSFSVEKK